MELLKTEDVCKMLHKNRRTVQLYRDAGLLKMFRFGKSYVTSQEEVDRFIDYCIQHELDLSSPERIYLAGMALKKAEQ